MRKKVDRCESFTSESFTSESFFLLWTSRKVIGEGFIVSIGGEVGQRGRFVTEKASVQTRRPRKFSFWFFLLRTFSDETLS